MTQTKTQMKRWIGALTLASAATAAAPEAFAQDIQIRGPLANARSVARMVRYREGRFSLTPTFGVTLQDEFSRELLVGARAEYHFTDWLGVGVWGAGAVAHIDTSLTDQVVQRSPGNTPNVPNRDNFNQQVGRRNWLVDLHVSFIPLRGKFALFQNLVADVDFYVTGGVAFVGVEERADATLASSTVGLDGATAANSVRDWRNNQVARSSRVAIAPTFGFGINFFINRFVSIGFEYRAMPFSWNRAGTDENSVENLCGPNGTTSCEGFSDIVATYFRSSSNPRAANGRRAVIDENDRSFSFNQMVMLGVSIYLPTAPHIGP